MAGWRQAAGLSNVGNDGLDADAHALTIVKSFPDLMARQAIGMLTLKLQALRLARDLLVDQVHIREIVHLVRHSCPLYLHVPWLAFFRDQDRSEPAVYMLARDGLV